MNYKCSFESLSNFWCTYSTYNDAYCRDAKELSRRDKQAVRGFCIYLGKESDEIFYQLNKQKEHDTHRYHKVRQRALFNVNVNIISHMYNWEDL